MAHASAGRPASRDLAAASGDIARVVRRIRRWSPGDRAGRASTTAWSGSIRAFVSAGWNKPGVWYVVPWAGAGFAARAYVWATS